MRYKRPATRKGRGSDLNNMQLAQQMFTSPAKVFAALKERPVFGLPMWLMLLGTALVTGWYYGIVDIAWLQDQQLEAANIPRPSGRPCEALRELYFSRSE
jgi:hypothetical protein